MDDEHDAEQRHFSGILASFVQYAVRELGTVDAASDTFERLPAAHRELLPEFGHRLETIRSRIKANGEFLQAIVEAHQTMHGDDLEADSVGALAATQVSDLDHEKACGTIRQFVREWSAAGAPERDAAFQPILDELTRRFPEPAGRKVLVPGSGLGRLVWECAKRGFAAQGNEVSYHMLLASNLILNHTDDAGEHTLYPYVSQWSNVADRADQVRGVVVPDVCPASLPEGADMSMTAGDFTEVYLEPAWDAVATCFFIDTGRSIFSYIETIHHILKPGGLWINLGPLLYHFADMPGETCVQLSFDEVRRFVTRIGFEILEERFVDRVPYNVNERSMLSSQYRCVWFVARRK